MSDRPPQSLEAFRQESLLKRNWILFWSYIKITSLVLGGGYAIIAAAQEEFVRRRGWLTDDDGVEMITITQTVPGILACNSAIYVGWRIVTALKMRKKAVRNVFGWCVAIGCFVGLSVFRISPAWLIVAAIAAGLIKVGVGSALKKIHPEKGEAAQ